MICLFSGNSDQLSLLRFQVASFSFFLRNFFLLFAAPDDFLSPAHRVLLHSFATSRIVVVYQQYLVVSLDFYYICNSGFIRKGDSEDASFCVMTSELMLSFETNTTRAFGRK